MVEYSVIIPVKDGAKTLGRQLEALSHQTDAPPFEVLVVDNGSKDMTAAVISSWASDSVRPEVKFVEASERAGVSHARNSGAEYAKGKCLAFCDSDDRVADRWLASAKAAIDCGSDFVGGPNFALINGNPTATILTNSLLQVTHGSGVVLPWQFALGCNFAVTREAFEAAGRFDESLPPYGSEDLGFCIRLSKAEWRLTYCPEMLVYREEHRGLDRLFRKYAFGVAEVCVWERHPEIFGGIPSRSILFGWLGRILGSIAVDRNLSSRERIRMAMSAIALKLGNLGRMRRLHKKRSVG